jgi:DNA polymerase-3 subunit gamma/tau
VRVLSRAWQMLVKGIAEVAQAPRPMLAADMVLVRLCHAADLPTPDEALRMLSLGGASHSSAEPRPQGRAAPANGGSASRPQSQATARAEPRPAAAAVPAVAPAPELRRFEDVITRARAERDVVLANALERWVRPVRFEPGQVEIALTPDADPGLPQRLGQVLQKWTGRRWIIVISREEVATETARETKKRDQAALMDEVRADPLVREVLEKFPGAEIIGVREPAQGTDSARVRSRPADEPVEPAYEDME